MKYWTIQGRNVVETLQTDGGYFPSFEKSTYVAANPKLAQLYSYLLNSYNSLNYGITSYMFQGLVFCFAEWFNQKPGCIVQFDDYQQFANAMTEYEQKLVIKALLNFYRQSENYILEIDLDPFYLNPLPVEINNFQAIMPPMTAAGPYDEEKLRRICKSIEFGVFEQPAFPSERALVQMHLPYINAEWVSRFYPFDL